MNSAQIHLAINHAPLFFSAIGGLILALGFIRKNEDFKKLSFYFLIAASALTIPVFFTGEGTEELVEHLPGVNEAAIEEHEGMAKISMAVIAITGVIALAGMILQKKTGIGKIVAATALLLSVASFATMAQTAHLGGLIRHTELQSGNAASGNENEKDDEKTTTEDKTSGTKSPDTQLPDSMKHEDKEKDDDD